jgi:glycosyltransferase involved in cell wall biosynthesis
MGTPFQPAARVSVVMGVRNGADTLASTIESLTSQQGVDLEVIVVNDGSTDTTGEILDALVASDDRIRVHHREGRGLTESLIEGCQMAEGEFIARQDAGDWSLPGRLQQQAACLRAHPEASLCSTHVRCLVAEGATVRVNAPDPATLADGLTGPAIHGSVMMRRSAYLEAGGYRQAFYYAQDIDLWSRMVELGSHRVLPVVLYEATLSPGSISGCHRREQEIFYSFIVGASKARRSGSSEAPWLLKASALSQQCRLARRSSGGEADGAYFIGACLAADQPDLARLYLNQALELNPWHLKARLRLARL